MAIRYWTCHWQNHFWRPDINIEGESVNHSAGSSFTKRGISRGDVVYVISLSAGQLFLVGRMTVDRILEYREAVEFFGTAKLWEAPEHLIGVKGSGTPLDLHRRLSPALTKKLRFESKEGPKEPCFISDTDLDNQATRGVRELTPESAALLDRIILLTNDNAHRTEDVLTVTETMLQTVLPPDVGGQDVGLPEEVPPGSGFVEGALRRIEVNRYERDPGARRACIAALGDKCHICGFSFAATYGRPALDTYIFITCGRSPESVTNTCPIPYKTCYQFARIATRSCIGGSRLIALTRCV